MAFKRPRVEHLKTAVAFFFAIVVGIAVGYVCTAAEAIEDKLKAGSRPSGKQTDKRR
jgi:hypothetical protein